MVAPLEEREVEHIDHLAHHKWCVRAAKLRYVRWRRCREEQTVECAVDDVAECTSDYQRQPHNHTHGCLLADEIVGVVAQATHQHKAEERERQLAPIKSPLRGYLHTECSAIILDKEELKPIGNNHNRLSEVHRGLDPNLERLIRHKQRHHKERNPQRYTTISILNKRHNIQIFGANIQFISENTPCFRVNFVAIHHPTLSRRGAKLVF